MPPLGRGRRWALPGLAAGVLWLHGLLIVALAPALPPWPGPGDRGTAQRPPLQVRTVAGALAATPPGKPAWPAPAPAPAVAPLPTERAARPRATPAALAIVEAAPALVAPTPGRTPSEPALAEAGPPSDGREDAASPPPVYATRIPPPARLRYALRYNGRIGEAMLDWRHDGRAYALSLDGRASAASPDGRGATQPLVVQASQGGFDAAGLAPERYTDRRRGRRLQAANFRRDIGRVGFSGTAADYPAWPGAQDRLSWLPQFAAVLAAAEAPPAVVSLFVVDARGAASLWHFRPDGDELLATPLGDRDSQRWRREPPRPEGLRVEAWFAATGDGWPLQLRFTALRSGDVFELQRLDDPAAPP